MSKNKIEYSTTPNGSIIRIEGRNRIHVIPAHEYDEERVDRHIEVKKVDKTKSSDIKIIP